MCEKGRQREKQECLHQRAVYRLRKAESDGPARAKKAGSLWAATVEAPVVSTDGAEERRTAEWLFAIVRTLDGAAHLHLGADTFINAAPILTGGKFRLASGFLSDLKLPRPSQGFFVPRALLTGIADSSSVRVRKLSPGGDGPLSEEDLAKVERRLRSIVDPRGMWQKDRCRMAVDAMLDIQRQLSVLHVMDA